MEDIKGFIWVIAAIGFFIWRMVQKAAEKAKEAQKEQRRREARQGYGAAPTPRPAPAVPAPAVPAVSFEELLAQMQRQNKQEDTPPPARPLAERDPPQEWEQRQQQWDAEQRDQPPPYGQEQRPTRAEPVGRYARSLEKIEVELHSQELPAPEAHSLEAPKRAARRADTMPRTSTAHGQEDYWSRQQAAPHQTRRTVNELLQNPADIRAAFVLSEIFARRY